MSITIVRRANFEIPESLHLFHPVLQRIYAARGINAATELDQGLAKLLPFDLLKGIDEAVACLVKALTQQQSIVIIGDFDADGATSTAVAVSALTAFGAQHVHYLVPNRFEYGYGLTPEIVAVAIATTKPDILITVDNGISSIAGVAAAKAQGMTVVITDHHLAAAELPAADAIVNPNQPGCLFPSKHLAGVGVIFYVMLALRARLRQLDWFKAQGILEPNLGQLLDLVALGTVADVVPLDHNNRIMVQQGLQRIRKGQCRLGIKALLAIAKRQLATITAADLGYAVAPRLNAAGRLDDMSLGIACLLAQDELAAQRMAAELDQLNLDRRSIEADMQQQALSALSQLKLEPETRLPTGLCLYNEAWHQGVIGILASRIKDKLHRPVIAFAKGTHPEELKGSARSVNGVHIRDVLDSIAASHPNLITKFGGHAMAAGLSLPQAHYQQFCQAFNQEVEKHLDPSSLQGIIQSDGELLPDELNLSLAEMLKEAGPWGQHFAEPIFDGYFNIVQQRLLADKHLKMVLKVNEQLIDAIAFNVNTEIWPNHRCEQVRLAYRLDVNEYRGQKNVQLIVEHLEAN